MSSITSLTYAPFTAMKVGDIFAFDASVARIPYGPNTFVKDGYFGGGSGVTLGVRYVMFDRFDAVAPGGDLEQCCYIFRLNSPNAFVMADRSNVNLLDLGDMVYLEWYPEMGPLDLNVRHMGNIFDGKGAENIPQYGDLMTKTNGKKCPTARVESVRIRDNRIKVDGRYSTYYLDPADNLSRPHPGRSLPQTDKPQLRLVAK